MNRCRTPLKYRFIFIILIVFTVFAGCASSKSSLNTQTLTDAELEQMAKRLQGEGMFEESNAIYRQLIAQNPNHITSLFYQREILLNTQALSDPNILITEILNASALIEKAQTEPLDDSSHIILEAEKDWLGHFIMNTAKWHGLVAYNDTKFYSWFAYLCAIILKDGFMDIFTLDDIESLKDRVARGMSGTQFRDKYIYDMPDFYDHLFELYEKGAISFDSITPMDIIKQDVMQSNMDPIETAARLGFAFSHCGGLLPESFSLVNIATCDFGVRLELHERDQYCSIPHISGSEKNDDSAIPIPECWQSTIHSAERLSLLNPNYDDILYQYLGNVYFNLRHFEQSRSYFWKFIYKNINTQHDLSISAALKIVYSYIFSKDYDGLKKTIQTFKNTNFFGRCVSLECKQFQTLIDEFVKVIDTCDASNGASPWSDAEYCYTHLDPLSTYRNKYLPISDGILYMRFISF